jgi:hypothetical protein
MSEENGPVIIQDFIVPNCEFSLEISITARFTKVFKSRNEIFWIYWKSTGSLPASFLEMGMIKQNKGVKLGEVFSPLPKFFYRLVEFDGRLHLQKLEQEK